MAKRRSPAEPNSQNNDPFDADIDDLNLEDLNIDDPPMGDIDLDTPIQDESVTSAGLNVAQAVFGLIQVILLGAVLFVVMIALGLGVVFAGQRIGVVPSRPASNGGAIALLPTQPAPEVVVVPPTATPLPAVTADPDCSVAQDWWNSQPVQSNYAYFTEQVLALARDANNIAALTEQMRIHRDFVANYPADLCLTLAKAALLKAFDATIALARAVNARNDATVAEQQPIEAQAYADFISEMRDVGVNVPVPGTSG